MRGGGSAGLTKQAWALGAACPDPPWTPFRSLSGPGVEGSQVLPRSVLEASGSDPGIAQEVSGSLPERRKASLKASGSVP